MKIQKYTVHQGIEVKGNFEFTGVLEINGLCEGSLVCKGSLLLGNEGAICGSVTVLGDLVIRGKVVGNITSEVLTITKTAQIHGNMVCTELYADPDALTCGISKVCPDLYNKIVSKSTDSKRIQLSKELAKLQPEDSEEVARLKEEIEKARLGLAAAGYNPQEGEESSSFPEINSPREKNDDDDTNSKMIQTADNAALKLPDIGVNLAGSTWPQAKEGAGNVECPHDKDELIQNIIDERSIQSARRAQKMRKKLHKAMEEKDRLAAQLAQLQEEAQEAAIAQNNLKNSAETVAQQAIEAAIQLEQGHEEIRELQQFQKKLVEQLNEKWEKKLNKKTEPLLHEVSQLKKTLETRNQELNCAEMVKEELEVKLTTLAENHAIIEEYKECQELATQEIKELQREYASTTKMLEQRTEELKQNKQHYQSLQKAITKREDEMRGVLEAQEEREHQLQNELTELMACLMEVMEELSLNQMNEAELDLVKTEREAIKDQTTKLHDEVMLFKNGVKKMTEQVEEERKLREEAEYQIMQERNERAAATAQLMALYSHHAADIESMKEKHSEEHKRLQATIDILENDKAKIRNELYSKEDKLLQLESQLKAMRSNSTYEIPHRKMEELVQINGENAVLKKRLQRIAEEEEQRKKRETEERDRRITELQTKIQDLETKRRKMHNVIQELRGNVRVFVRVRPFLESDSEKADQGASTIVPHADGVSLVIQRTAGSLDTFGEELKTDKFSFDKVFPSHSGQDEVFEEVSEFVQSALDGYNVCLFSYGQTASGKTHTMQGVGNGPMRGIIPRAIEQVGVSKEALELQGWKYEMEVSFLEIYNDNINDLLWQLAPDPDYCKKTKKAIKYDAATGSVNVTGLTLVPMNPKNHQQIEKVMAVAARQRSVGRTDMNSASSRSHSVFTLHLKARNAEEGREMTGKLNLVDLAGSERLERSGVTGERLKETKAINASLSCLSDVFRALSHKNHHIPYRNSKLTQLLKPALSGDGKTLMILNLSPTKASYSESLSSLRFGSNVNQCELGRAKRNLKDTGQGQDSPQKGRQAVGSRGRTMKLIEEGEENGSSVMQASKCRTASVTTTPRGRGKLRSEKASRRDLTPSAERVGSRRKSAPELRIAEPKMPPSGGQPKARSPLEGTRQRRLHHAASETTAQRSLYGGNPEDSMSVSSIPSRPPGRSSMRSSQKKNKDARPSAIPSPRKAFPPSK